MPLKIAKPFRPRRSQAVRRPREFRFESDHVYTRKSGNGILLLRALSSWDSLIGSLAQFSADFIEDRKQPAPQRR
jgi:antitoxin VapB